MQCSLQLLTLTHACVSRLLQGGSLRRLVHTAMVQLTEEIYKRTDAVRWAIQLAEALSYLHNSSPPVSPAAPAWSPAWRLPALLHWPDACSCTLTQPAPIPPSDDAP